MTPDDNIVHGEDYGDYKLFAFIQQEGTEMKMYASRPTDLYGYICTRKLYQSEGCSLNTSAVYNIVHVAIDIYHPHIKWLVKEIQPTGPARRLATK